MKLPSVITLNGANLSSYVSGVISDDMLAASIHANELLIRQYKIFSYLNLFARFRLMHTLAFWCFLNA